MLAAILAGGSGTRLWPLSRSHYPKQFLKLGDTDSFLQKTVRRCLKLVAPSDLYIVTSAHYYPDVVRQVAEIDPTLKENILVEPVSKNTAPAAAFLATYLRQERRYTGAELLFVTPADHLVSPEESLIAAIHEGAKLAKNGLVTFGVRPTRPETGYGYIQAKGSRVFRFVEKPDLKTAIGYLESGDFFWNSGMFLFSLDIFDEELQTHAPDLASSDFETMPSISLDYAIMEKSHRLFMVPLDLSWSDVGSWDNVYESLEKDDRGNATLGTAELFDTRRTLVVAEKRMVVTIDVEDLLIIETDDVILVASKNSSQKVKEVVASLKTKGRKEIEEHATIFRPWGSYTVLGEGKRYKIKKILVSPLQKLSLQLHYHRSEHWVVVKGTAKVTIGSEERLVHEGESIFVPKSAIHRMENPGKVDLEIIEVQVGEYLGEDDIVRLEDVYGRLKEAEVFKLLQEKS